MKCSGERLNHLFAFQDHKTFLGRSRDEGVHYAPQDIEEGWRIHHQRFAHSFLHVRNTFSTVGAPELCGLEEGTLGKHAWVIHIAGLQL